MELVLEQQGSCRAEGGRGLEEPGWGSRVRVRVGFRVRVRVKVGVRVRVRVRVRVTRSLRICQ